MFSNLMGLPIYGVYYGHDQVGINDKCESSIHGNSFDCF